MSKLVRGLIPLAVVAAVASWPIGADDAARNAANETAATLTTAEAEELFALEILPLMQEKCFGCHGADEADLKGDLDLRTLAATLAGGESEEPALHPHDAENSIFYQAVMWDGYEMPPKENDRFTPDQCAAVKAWIDAGAPWPDAERRDELRREDWARIETDDGRIVPTSGGLADEWTFRRYDPREIWAFSPVSDPAVPPGWASPVDAFVRARLKTQDVQPAPPAQPRELLRRVTFDLTGLPPTPEETDAFLAASEADPERAYAELVDRLLASPHYGERQAQHWLDVARYADTGGLSNDYERSNAWRYRDWVVRALNADLPYDLFAAAQLAGDELAAAVEAAERSDEANEADDPAAAMADSPLVARVRGASTVPVASYPLATGFLRMGPWDTAMIPKEEARQIFLDDVTHNVGQTFLSMPMRCCKCHDHKFDPIPTRDYYRLSAVFAASQPAEVDAPFVDDENRDGFDAGRAHVERMYKIAKTEFDRLNKKREDAARVWYESRGLEYKDYNARKDDPDDTKPARAEGLTVEEEGTLKQRMQDEWIWNRRRERYKPMMQSVFNGSPGKFVNARKLRPHEKTDPDWQPETAILLGGALDAPADAVWPGVLSGTGVPPRRQADASPDGPSDPYRLPATLHNRRLALAEWIADPANPLSTRSIVNRIWQTHFGRGLVGTANNLGVKGDAPTHPQLLDWLTRDFVANGWTMKRLHRLIVMSDTYRQSTRHPDRDALATVDPNNDLLAAFPPRRLSAEELRDAMLLASGELNPALGGVPAKPEINMEVALQPRMIQFSLAPAYQPSPRRSERNRRSLYAYRVRGQADPMMQVFGLPNPNDSCELRDSAAVTPQAFTLLNSDATTDRALALAVRVQNESDDMTGQLRRAFRLTLGRVPSDDEAASLAAYVARMTDYHAATEPQPVAYPTSLVRSNVEEISGQPFQYVESLPAFEDYEPDVKPADVDAATRALADACLVLLNCNEFVYVY